MEFLFTASIEKKKSEDMSICHPSSFAILQLSSRKAVKEALGNFLQKKQRLHILLFFLQKLGSQKPCWDQARLPQPGK